MALSKQEHIQRGLDVLYRLWRMETKMTPEENTFAGGPDIGMLLSAKDDHVLLTIALYHLKKGGVQNTR